MQLFTRVMFYYHSRTIIGRIIGQTDTHYLIRDRVGLQYSQPKSHVVPA